MDAINRVRVKYIRAFAVSRQNEYGRILFVTAVTIIRLS